MVPLGFPLEVVDVRPISGRTPSWPTEHRTTPRQYRNATIGVRWKRQIMDQFEVKIQNVHVCLENMERNSRVGLMFESLGINSINSIGVSGSDGPDVLDGIPLPARQHVEVTSCRIYVCASTPPELFQVPDDEHFVMREEHVPLVMPHVWPDVVS